MTQLRQKWTSLSTVCFTWTIWLVRTALTTGEFQAQEEKATQINSEIGLLDSGLMVVLGGVLMGFH